MAKTLHNPGAVVLIDGLRRVRIIQTFPEGSTSFVFPHYEVEAAVDPAEAYITLTDRTGSATERCRARNERFIVAAARVKR